MEELRLKGLLQTELVASGGTVLYRQKNKEKSIPIRNIINIEHKPPKKYSNGTIKIQTGEAPSGALTLGFGVTAIMGNENCIVYDSMYAKDAQRIVDYIVGYSDVHAQPVSAPSVSDEIFKLKALLDSGAITPDEFSVLKKRVIDGI